MYVCRCATRGSCSKTHWWNRSRLQLLTHRPLMQGNDSFPLDLLCFYMQTCAAMPMVHTYSAMLRWKHVTLYNTLP